MIKRKDIEERSKYRIGNSDFGGRSNWDTYETANIIQSNESLYEMQEALSENYNEAIKYGRFNEEHAKKQFKQFIFPILKKEMLEGKCDYINLDRINLDELIDETILMTDPYLSKKKNHKLKNSSESELEVRCREKNMDYVPGYKKEDGTYVHAYCRHTKFTDYMRKKRRMR